MDLATLLSAKNLVLFVVIFTRLWGMITSAPLVSSYPIPIQIKTWFMAIVAFIIFPIVMTKIGFQMPTSIPALAFILIKEFLIGFLIGFIANLVFVGVEIAGDLVAMQMGLNSAQELNPSTGHSSPILTQAYTILASFAFIGLNAFSFIFIAIMKSFFILPPGYGFLFGNNLTQNMVAITSQMFIVGLGIAMPVFAVMIITNILLGVVAKMMPKINIFMVSMPVKIYLGFLVLAMLAKPMYTELVKLFKTYLAHLVTLLGG